MWNYHLHSRYICDFSSCKVNENLVNVTVFLALRKAFAHKLYDLILRRTWWLIYHYHYFTDEISPA